VPAQVAQVLSGKAGYRTWTPPVQPAIAGQAIPKRQIRRAVRVFIVTSEPVVAARIAAGLVAGELNR
jgi:hypothetical protein